MDRTGRDVFRDNKRRLTGGRHLWTPPWRSALLAMLVAGCGSDNQAPAPSGPVKACQDMAYAVAKAAQRACGQDYQANYDAFVQTAANGSCQNIISVRDEAGLRSVCLPWLSTATCAQLAATTLFPAECKTQLLHN
jgi:hypothetical protein